jgi:MFS family permease
MFTLAPAYVNQVLGIADQDSYVILVPATVGALISAAALGQVGRRFEPGRLLTAALVATGLTLVMLAVVPAITRDAASLRPFTRWIGATFSLLLGLEFGALMIPAVSYLMENTSDDLRGRIFSLLFMVVNGVTAVPVLLTAALSDWLGIERVIAGLGVLLAGAGLAVATSARRIFESGAGAPQR